MENPHGQPHPVPAAHDTENQNQGLPAQDSHPLAPASSSSPVSNVIPSHEETITEMQNIVPSHPRASSLDPSEQTPNTETNPITSNFRPRGANSQAREDHKYIKELENQIRALKKEIFRLANYYFVFQGVIITALFGGSSSLKCQYSWQPITLSATAGVLNLIALICYSMELTRLADLRDWKTIIVEYSWQDNTGAKHYYEFRKNRRKIIMWSSVILLICFILVLQVGTWKILCDDNDCTSLRSIKNCIRLCGDHDKCVLLCPQS